MFAPFATLMGLMRTRQLVAYVPVSIAASLNGMLWLTRTVQPGFEHFSGSSPDTVRLQRILPVPVAVALSRLFRRGSADRSPRPLASLER